MSKRKRKCVTWEKYNWREQSDDQAVKLIGLMEFPVVL